MWPKQGVRNTTSIFDRKNKVIIFMHMQLRDALSEWHQLYSGGVYPPMHGRPQSKFEENIFSHSQDTHKSANFCKKNSFSPSLPFHTFYRNFYYSQICIPISLKFEAKANTCTTFNVNKMNIHKDKVLYT